jgi:hypothetical protein
MYEELVKRLREAPNDWPDADLHYVAADAIEDLEFACNRYEKDYKALCAYLPKWIPVAERLPELRMAVIVYAPYMKNEFMAYWTGSRWMVWAAGEYEREMPEYHQITHWIPLPEPPKEET